ncbi:MAG: YigZ family protein [Bacteroidia bacterium]|nr:YigZ family protein [Bacteroidia bacterium]
MNSEKDTYNTIRKPSTEVLFKDRGSKFYGYAYPVDSEEEIKESLDTLKKQHHAARHFCYAWYLGETYDRSRANDDGEPTNSAGMPILGQLQAFELTNVLVVVVRYFGGTKLGVGGLMKAYKQTAKTAIENSPIVKRTIDERLRLHFEYAQLNMAMRIIKEQELKIVHQKLEMDCEIIVAVRRKEVDRIFELLENTFKISVKRI